MCRTKLAVLCIGAAVVLSACGGGGGNDSSDGQNLTIGGDQDSDVGIVQDSNLGNNEPAEISSVRFDERTVRAVVATGSPVAGVPESKMVDVGNFMLNDSGVVAYTGSYSTSHDDIEGTEVSAIWSGPPDAAELLLSTGSEITGLPSNVRYGRSDFFELASDGSLAHLVELTGPTPGQALLLTKGLDSSVLVRTGNTLQGRVAPIRVSSIRSLKHSASLTAFASATGSGRNATQTLWQYQNGVTVAVAEPFSSTVETAPEVSNSCSVFSGRTINYEVTDSGEIFFDASVRNISSGPCVSGNAVIRFQGGAYSALVKEGDDVPGSLESVFSDVRLVDVTNNGIALVSANIETPSGNFRPNSQWSYWAFVPDESPHLVALEGEETQVGSAVKVFSSSSASELFAALNENRQVAFKVDFDDTNQTALFGGSPHSGQPHAAITSPGASALTYAIDRVATLPEPLSSEFFSTFGSPLLTGSGKLVFYGELTSSESNTVVSSALWKIDLEGNLSRIIEAGYVANISDVDYRLDTIIQPPILDDDEPENVIDDTETIVVNNAGGILLMGYTVVGTGDRGDEQSTEKVIVYIDPVN